MKDIRCTALSLLSGLKLSVRFEDGSETTLEGIKEDGILRYEGEGVKGAVSLKTLNRTVLFDMDFEADKPFAEYNTVNFTFSFDEGAKITDNHLDGIPWWTISAFPKDASEITDATQNLIVNIGSRHYSFLMLLGDQCRCEADGKGLHAAPYMTCLTKLTGPFLSVNEGDDPITAVADNYRNAHELGGIRVPLIDEREYPSFFEYFGFCCWNTFYRKVTSAGLYEKLDEFKEKGIKIKWMIIDDGWQQYNGDELTEEQLTSFEVDPVKFPEGLKGCIDRIKKEYGVEYVGVWHAYNAYWAGVEPNSQLAKDYADCLVWGNPEKPEPYGKKDILIPSTDPEKAFKFWDGWHSYLAKNGVDFLKVDNQSSSYYYFRGVAPAGQACRDSHEALEKSIKKNFGGYVINCMGMEMGDVLTRPYSAVTRNSDDFFPDRENGFAKHLRQNAYNSIFHSNIIHCDYDMWWSGLACPVQSGLLRAISGGPVYVSDEIGKTNPDNILPICGEDGNICRPDHAAMPTLDDIYVDCEKEKRPLKIYNRSGENIALAVFNPTREDVEEEFRFNVIPDIDGYREYIAFEYFTKKFERITAQYTCRVKLAPDEVRAYSLFPITFTDDGNDNDAYIMLGDTSKYISAASKAKKKVFIRDITF